VPARLALANPIACNVKQALRGLLTDHAGVSGSHVV
jgi:hypothetical protein